MGNTTVKGYDAIGREAAVLYSGEAETGEHTVDFNPAAFGLSSGVYFCRLISGSKAETIKMLHLK